MGQQEWEAYKRSRYRDDHPACPRCGAWTYSISTGSPGGTSENLTCSNDTCDHAFTHFFPMRAASVVGTVAKFLWKLRGGCDDGAGVPVARGGESRPIGEHTGVPRRSLTCM